MIRPAIVGLITKKELRDLLRDRRTVMLILVLPAVLYPLFGLTGYAFAASLLGKPARVAVVNIGALPATPPLLVNGKLAEGLDPADLETAAVEFTPSEGDPDELIRDRKADVVLVIPPGLAEDLAKREPRPKIRLVSREGDDKSKLATRRVVSVLRAWEGKLRAARFEKAGLPADFDKILTIEDPLTDKPKGKRAADELRDTFARVFPFILMMWLVAGAIQPAVDMTAGEKERGTMETLLISPAERSEIVLGKFLATTVFSFTSVVWNVTWLTGAGIIFQTVIGFPIVHIPGLVGCVVLGLPLAMLFSAVCLALGVFARSTKEGQYYLMPLILLTMPLAFWGMMPGTELDWSNCWVPVTGAMLLQQKLLAVTGEPIPWEFFPPVLGSLAVWVTIALTYAGWQFRREQVLFRETGPERKRGWFRRSATPTE